MAGERIMDVTPFRSAIAESAWPAVPTPRGAVLLAMQYQLERGERWAPEAIRRAQFRQIEIVLRHAVSSVPYYRDRLGGARIDASRLDAPETWRRIPLLTRQDIQGAGDALVSTALPKEHGNVQRFSTSGSTGAPVTTHGTDLTEFFFATLTLRHYLWHAFDFKRKLAIIRDYPEGGRAFPEGSHIDHWGPLISSAFVTGPAAELTSGTPIADQIAWLEREQPDYLVTYPSNLAALLRHCGQNKSRLPSLRKVQTLGEVLAPETRELCREVWNLDIVDMYSAQEVGYIALQCPEREHYHIQAENLLVEVIDDRGEPCRPHETGRVVVTTLHNFAMPLIRYAVGDFATVGEACSCGRGLPVLARIMGRARNMLTLPTGDQIWPSFGGYRFREFAPIRQYQLIQKDLTALEMRVVADRPLTGEEQEQIRKLILGKIGSAFSIGFVYRDSIPRGAGGKFEDFRSELP